MCMEYKRMREYTHEEIVELIQKLSDEQLLELSANYGGYPVEWPWMKEFVIYHLFKLVRQ